MPQLITFFTRYRTEYCDSSSRLDYVFASLDMHGALPTKEASVLQDQTFCDHHPVTASLQVPSPILLPTPPLPPMVSVP